MRPPSHLIVGFVCGALLGSLVLVGPTRLGHLYCSLADCPISTTLDSVCDIATKAELVDPSQRARFLAKEFSSQWPTAEAVELAHTVDTSPPGEKYDAILDVLGGESWSCPAVTRLLSAPIASSMRRVVVDGVIVANLSNGLVADADLDQDKLVIDPLYQVLRRRPREVLKVGVHPSLPFRTIAQILYTAGLADQDEIDLKLLDLNVPAVRISLAPYGTCMDCLAEIGDAKRGTGVIGEPILALIGHRAATPSSKQHSMLSQDALRLVAALANHGDAWVAARGGVLAPRVGPESGATVPRGRHGPEFSELEARLRQVRQSFADQTGIVATADLDTRASQFHRLLVTLRGTDKPLFETTMVAVPVALFQPYTVISDVFRDAEGVTFSTRAQLTRGAEPVAPVYTNAATRPVPAPRRTATPRAKKRTTAPSTAPLSRSGLAALFRPHLGSVSACYEEGLRDRPSLAGRVMLRLDVLEDGTTDNVRVDDQSLGSASVARCIAERAEEWQLDAPAQAPVSVAYPLSFKPSR